MAKKPMDRYQTPAELAAALSGQSSKLAPAAIANDGTIAEGEQAEAAREERRDALVSAFSYIRKRDDTIPYEAPQPVHPKPRNRRWLLLGVAVGFCFLVGLVVLLVVKIQGSAEKKHPEAKKEDLPKKDEAPSKYFTNGLGMKFVWIPPGSFMMGSPKEEKARGENETQHKVTLTKGFYMGVYPVTQEQWQAVMGNNPSHFKGNKNLPVEKVSWNDCQEFNTKLTDKERQAGKITVEMEYTLPTEAEWEYCCRAGTTTRFHFGETISTDQANYNGDFVYGNGKKGADRHRTTEVGSFPANAWGLHDMHGNVWQRCEDAYDPDFYINGITKDPLCRNGKGRVLRGGSFLDTPHCCRGAFRFYDRPEYFFDGFRVVLRLSPRTS